MNRLKELRNENDMKQSDLGKLLGVRDSVISRYERGIISIPVDTLQKLSEIFHVSTDYILCLTSDRNPNHAADSLTEPALSQELQRLIEGYKALPVPAQLVLLRFVEATADKKETAYAIMQKILELPPHAQQKVTDYVEMVSELEASKNGDERKKT